MKVCTFFLFKRRIEILNNNKEKKKQWTSKIDNPASATDVPHQYEDKFAAAEFLTNTAMAAEQVGAFPSIWTIYNRK